MDVWQCSAMHWVPAELVGAHVTAGLMLIGVPILQHYDAGVCRESPRTPQTCCISVPEHFLTFPVNVPVHPHRLGIAFAYYGVILASAELLERDLSCSSTAPLGEEDPGPASEESRSPCHCRPFGPSAYQTMIISTAGEIARNLLSPPCPSRPSVPPAHAHCAVLLTEHPVGSPSILRFSFLSLVNPVNILGINFLGRRLSLCITMGCTALFFLLLNICTSR